MEEPQRLTSPKLSGGPKDADEKHQPGLEAAKSEVPLQINLFTRDVEQLKLDVVEPTPEREGEEIEI
jgi:hypothetical protein